MSLMERATTLVPAGTWQIDPAHTTVEFAISHLGITTVKGRATAVAGTITGGESARIEGTVAAAAVTTHDASRDEHLRSPEFFDVERHPELRLVSTSVDGEPDAVVVSAELTIRGVTRTVELRGRVLGPRTDPWGGDRIGLDLEGEVDRTDFGLRWNAPLPGGGFLLDDTVRLTASLSAVRSG